MVFLKALVIAAAWMIFDWAAGYAEKKLPERAFAALRWGLVLPAAMCGLFVALWLFDAGIFWPAVAWPGFVLFGAAMAPTRQAIVGCMLFGVIFFAAWDHGEEAWRASKTRRWMSDIVGLGIAIAGITLIHRDQSK